MQNARTVPIGLLDESVAVGAHVAYFWESDREFNDGIRFLTVGLDRGDFCVIFGHEQANRQVTERLSALGYDTDALITSQRLALLSGQTDGSAMLDSIGATFTQAMAEGATLIRLLGNLGWGHEGWPSEHAILEFEGKVTGAAKRFPCVVLCMYDVRALPGRVIVHGAYETHPLTICGNVLRENTHYVEIDQFLSRLRAAGTDE